jgi:hypothetical protein
LCCPVMHCDPVFRGTGYRNTVATVMTRIQNCSLAYQDNLGNIERQFFRFDTIFKSYITESLFRKKLWSATSGKKKKDFARGADIQALFR